MKKDLREELGAIIIGEELVGWLDDINLTAKTYGKAYIQLGQELASLVKSRYPADHVVNQYFRNLATNMEIWVEACEEIEEC